jgi:hypothetical protein
LGTKTSVDAPASFQAPGIAGDSLGYGVVAATAAEKVSLIDLPYGTFFAPAVGEIAVTLSGATGVGVGVGVDVGVAVGDEDDATAGVLAAPVAAYAAETPNATPITAAASRTRPVTQSTTESFFTGHPPLVGRDPW